MSFIPSPPHGYVPAPHKLVTQASMAAPSVESMFERIMETVQKSVSRCVSAALFSFLFGGAGFLSTGCGYMGMDERRA